LDELKLFYQEGFTSRNLFGFGVAVIRRPALNHISNVYLFPAKSHPFSDNLSEELAGSANKRLTFYIFIPPWCLPYKH
jgi:hypothetical protein